MTSESDTAERRSVSVLGLGPMGAPIARNLLSTYGPITVWNRTSSKSAPFEQLGARVAPTPADAACEVTLTVLPDLVQVQSLLEGETGLLAGWRRQGIAAPVLVVHGTVSPVGVAELAETMWAEHRLRVIDAPLSGGTVGADKATLSIMIGGDEATANSLMPILDHIGRTVRYLGPSGSGQLAKGCNQIVVAGTIAALSEALWLARTSGLDLTVLCELLQGGLARTEVLQQKQEKWIAEDFQEGGSARNQVKDLHFAQEIARFRGVHLPMTNCVTELFEHMVAEGEGGLDHTGLYLTIKRASVHPNGV
jgi:3-hydroxyisobutyrate dehydrogenase-like beta-hydroxyacid dehydrogenase